MKRLFIWSLAAAVLAGCGTPTPSRPAAERGPDGTIAYRVPVDSNPPGAQIEVNGQTMGVTPMTLKIFGDRDGTFHNFGSYEFIVRAYPKNRSQLPLTKIFHTGAFMGQEDKIPDRIHFEFNQP